MLMISLVAAFLSATPAPGPGAPASPRPYGIVEQLRLRRMSELRASPDGRLAVFRLARPDLEANRMRADLWLVALDGSAPRPLTTHPDSDGEPLWAPDGKSVFFVSTRSGSAQVWRIPVDGGEARQVTQSPVDVATFVLSRDGTRLAFAADTFADCADLDCTKRRLDEQGKQKASGRVYERLFVRHWDTWKDGRRTHLFVQRVDGGAPVDVTRGFDADAPPKPFGGRSDFCFTPDGQALVFAARDEGRSEAWSTNVDLFLVPVDGSKPPERLTASSAGTDAEPSFSPDGRNLAWLAMKRPGYEADKQRVMVRAWPSGAPREVAQAWDRSPSGLTWSADGKRLYAVADDVGQRSIFAVDVATGAVTKRFSDGHASDVTTAGDDLLFVRDGLDGPADAYLLSATRGGGPRRLTRLNDDVLAGVQLGSAEQLSFTGANGDRVYAYVVHPSPAALAAGAGAPQRKVPVALLIHGGPQGSFGNHWHYRWNPQIYAGRGYAALMVDFHGSTGYGQAFTDSIRGDWGGKPLEDLKAGLATALARHSSLDKNGVCALGASYGGYLVNWIAGVWNEPFRCLVTHSGNLDEASAYFMTEELWFPEWEHEGTPWDNPAGYQKHNPVQHVAKWRVPTLVVHGARDYRVVDTAGLATFTALQRRGVPSKLLHFPDENHWVLKPANSLQWHETVLDWLDQWTKTKAPEGPAGPAATSPRRAGAPRAGEN